MKPKDLKFPFRWEERRPLILDGILYVPKCYDAHSDWPKEASESFFSDFSSVAIEYCSGNGTWIAEKARLEPTVLWIAVEKRFDRVQKIGAKRHNLSLPNLRIVSGEALTFARYYGKDAAVDRVFINFPDPWPKAKHAKNRLLQAPFFHELAKMGKPGCETVIVTDDVPYSEQAIREITKEGIWKNVFSDPPYEVVPENYGTSYFDELWKSKGREIRYLKFIK